MKVNTRVRLNKLWEERHDHGDDTLQEQITIILNRLDEQEPSIGAAASGAYLHLSREATQTIGVGGAPISWDTQSPLLGRFEFVLSVPTAEITIGKTGYYGFYIELRWLTFTGGGDVWITRTRAGVETQVWPRSNTPGAWSDTNGDEFVEIAYGIPLRQGDIIQIHVDHNDGSSQELEDAVLAVGLIDRVDKETILDTYEEAVLADRPLAYWRLDEISGTTAEDFAGHQDGPFDATYTDSPDLNQAGIMADGSGSPSVGFDGTKHVAGQDWEPLDLTSGSFSIEAWFNAATLSASPTTGILIEKRNQSPSTEGWELGVTSDNGVSFLDDSGSLLGSGAGLATGTDYHVVVTHDGTTTKLYLNGAEVDSATGLTITANTQLVSIARDTAAAGLNFDGRIDEVAVYASALTPQRVVKHYEIGTRV